MYKGSFTIVFFALFLLVLPIRAQTIFYENFDGTSDTVPPSGWQNQLISGVSGQDNFRFDDPYFSSPFPSTSGGQFVTFSSFYVSTDGIVEEAILTTPYINCSGFTQIYLTFEHYFYQDADTGFVQIDISTDSGATWNTIYFEDSVESTEFPTYMAFDISTFVDNEPSVLVRFWANGNASISWLFDDVRLISGDIIPPAVTDLCSGNFLCFEDTLEISALVTDSSGIDTVYVRYRENSGPIYFLPLTPDSANIFVGKLVPSSGFGILDYQIVAHDSSVNFNKNYSTTGSETFTSIHFGGEGIPTSTQNFETEVSPYLVDNPDNSYTWEISSFASGFGSGAKALFIPFFDYDSVGHSDYLYSHNLKLDSSFNFLEFDVAYAQYSNEDDQLQIKISTDGGISWSSPIYSKSGSTLATTASNTSYFVPVASQWRKEIVDLSAYSGQCIKLAFVGTSDYGNNLYIDNIRVYSPFGVDMALMSAQFSAGCVNDTNSNLKVNLKNNGVNTITSVKINYQLNGGAIISETKSLSLGTNNNAQLTFSGQLNFNQGMNHLIVWTSDPNGQADESTFTDTIEYTPVVKLLKYASLPFSEDFESGTFNENWCAIPDSINGRIDIVDTLVVNCTSDHRVLISGELPGSGIYENVLDLYVDLSDYNQHQLEFDLVDFGEETHGGDAIYLSNDGGDNFTKIYSIDIDTAQEYQCVPVLLDLDSLAMVSGLTLTSNSVIRFGQTDNWSYSPEPGSSDGLSIDNVAIYNPTQGIKQEENAFKAMVYPNPFQSFAQLELVNYTNKPILIEVVSITGKLCETKWFAGNNICIGQSLEPGVYFVNIIMAENVYCLKVLKQ